MDKAKVIKGLRCMSQRMVNDYDDEELWCESCGYDHDMCMIDIVSDAISLLKEQEAKPPIHVHEEYPEHDWERLENGEIDDFAYDGDYHNGPMCKRCYYSFCIFCDPDGWNKKPCIIDEYKCPKCGRDISKGTKFCSNCGQAVKWG